MVTVFCHHVKRNIVSFGFCKGRRPDQFCNNGLQPVAHKQTSVKCCRHDSYNYQLPILYLPNLRFLSFMFFTFNGLKSVVTRLVEAMPLVISYLTNR